SPDTTLPFGWALYRHFRNRELDRSSVWTGLAMIQNRDFADAAAAITMGGRIWSMHFIAMLAFTMPIPMSYDIGLTALSLMVAIFVTGVGFYVISLDLVPKGRDEDGLKFPMEWVRRHDQY